MNDSANRTITPAPAEVLDRILEVGVNLWATHDPGQVLEKILHEVRKLARAEGGTLFIMDGDRVRIVAAQNDHPQAADALGKLLGRVFPVSYESLVGFVALTGRTVNLEDSYSLPPGAPFRVDRQFDLASGHRNQSILAIPLRCPDGRCIGALELFNCIAPDGRCVPFPDARDTGILSLAAMAAVTLHNRLLQDQLKEAHMDTILRLSMAAEFRDDDTGTHVCRISHVSALIARTMGLDDREVDFVLAGSPMHDVGKIGIPDRILQKPGALTPAERDLMQQHTWIGARILGSSRGELMRTAHDVALTHHERWDGKGYPQRLEGESIPRCGRIVSVADVFDALVSKRCYKPAYPAGQALEILRQGRESNFDPAVTDAFFCALDDILEFYEAMPNGYVALGRGPAPPPSGVTV